MTSIYDNYLEERIRDLINFDSVIKTTTFFGFSESLRCSLWSEISLRCSGSLRSRTSPELFDEWCKIFCILYLTHFLIPHLLAFSWRSRDVKFPEKDFGNIFGNIYKEFFHFEKNLKIFAHYMHIVYDVYVTITRTICRCHNIITLFLKCMNELLCLPNNHWRIMRKQKYRIVWKFKNLKNVLIWKPILWIFFEKTYSLKFLFFWHPYNK